MHTHNFFKFFRNGASNDMAIEGAPTMFKVTCPTTGTLDVIRINIVFTAQAMKYNVFGGGSALSTGITIKLYHPNDEVCYDYLDGETIKSNEDFGSLAGIDAIIGPAAGIQSLAVRWTLEKSGSITKLDQGEYIGINIQDDLSGVTKFTAMLQGVSF